ncbi:arylesterase [Comamonas sp. GB3 AK4-5]|uniref:arylesterase n=1 Tax=Comamonas sp. GB3 AK4-5 TaxID=3231487 RepID=UPI00351F2F7E
MQGNRRHFIALAAAMVAGHTAPLRAQDKPKGSTLLVLGDSLSAEYGLARGTGWVALLEQRLAQHQLPVHVANASISGETTAGGRSRLPSLLKRYQPHYVLIALGSNDALRGLSLSSTTENLRLMLQACQESGAQRLLVGMQMPPNYGAAYARDFAQMFDTVAQETRTALVPFLLKGVADAPNAVSLFQADRLHPNAQAQPQMLDNVWPALAKVLNARPAKA